MIIALFLIVGVLVVLVMVPVVLRSAVRDVKETEDRLHSPGAQTLSYLVPEGQDPTVLVAALHHAGYEVVADSAGGEQRLLIGCPDGREGSRAAVRSLIQDVHTTGIDGVGLRVDHARFEDEL
jgi:hypothetical protein